MTQPRSAIPAPSSARRWLGVLAATIWLAAVLLGGACDGCVEMTGSGDATTSGGGLDPGPMPEDVPMPGAVYQEAYDQALREINADNASDRLKEIERLVRREREEMR